MIVTQIQTNIDLYLLLLYILTHPQATAASAAFNAAFPASEQKSILLVTFTEAPSKFAFANLVMFANRQ